MHRTAYVVAPVVALGLFAGLLGRSDEKAASREALSVSASRAWAAK